MSGHRLAVAGLALAALAACAAFGATRPGLRTGPEIYADKCVYCHDAHGWGTRVLARRVPEGEAELVDRKDLPAAYTAYVVRRGVGSMPGFTPTDLSDKEVEIVAKWLDEKN